MLIDCDTCAVRGPGCPDCVVSVLLGPPADVLLIDDDERVALEVLARSGLVPPLRLVHEVAALDPEEPEPSGLPGARSASGRSATS